MPLLDFNRSVKEYWEQVKDEYPDMEFSKFHRVCECYMLAVRSWLQLETMPTIMLKYFGRLMVFPTRIKRMIVNNKIAFDKGNKSEEKYKTRDKWLREYLIELEKDEEKDDE